MDFVKYPDFILGTLVLGISVLLAGCGGGSSGTGSGCCGVPGINVDVVSPTGAAAVDDGPTQTLTVTVKVTGDSSNAGVTWMLAPQFKGGPTGSLAGQTAFSVMYTPPTGVTAPIQVIVTATSVTDTTRAAAIPISIYPPLVPPQNPVPLATGFLNNNYTCVQFSTQVAQVTCLVSVTGGLGPYTWSLGNTLLPPGLQLTPDPTDQTSIEVIGIPFATGVYPFTLTATDAT